MKYRRILVTIGTDKIEESVNFYQKLFGYPPNKYQKNIYAEFNLQDFTLGIFKPRTGEEEDFCNPDKKSRMSICLEVEDLELAIANLQDFGYPHIIKIKEGSTMRETYVQDPSGNRIIIYQYR
jgi:predicted enzyme related to lactoylglutathione lyase